MGTLFVYALTDPRSGEVRYVGKSCSGMQRPRMHSTPKALAADRTAKGNWVRKLLGLGMLYSVLVLEHSDSKASLSDAERRWIAYGRRAGWKLLNHTEGGDGAGYSPSAETREKIRRSRMGQSRPSVPRPDVAARNRGKQSPEFVERRIGPRRGKPGKSPDAVARAKMTASRAGKRASAETRARMREAQAARRARESG